MHKKQQNITHTTLLLKVLYCTRTHTHTHTHTQTYMLIYILLYINILVTRNQKSIVDIHRKKEDSTHNTKNSHQITKEEKRDKKLHQTKEN